jgi:membrane protease YdiL (CAAX protease family)
MAAVSGGLMVAGGMWVFMFRLDRSDIWPRTWLAAAVVSGYAIAAAVALGHARQLIGPVSPREVLVGVAVGGAWLVATHLGATVLGLVVPEFLDQIADLYRLADGDTVARMAGPLVAVAAAEELLFRGLIQGRAGLVVAVVAYAAVQLVEQKWALVLAAVFCGFVWGGLFTWRHGLVAPTVAHEVWTLALTLIWPIRRPRVGTDRQVRPTGRYPGKIRTTRGDPEG